MDRSKWGLAGIGCCVLLSLGILAGSVAGKDGNNSTVFGFAADGSEQETQYLYRDASNGIAGEHRFADELGDWIYYFHFADTPTELALDLRIGGQYLVEASLDGERWMEIAASTDNREQGLLRVELAPLFREGGEELLLKFSDRNPADGFGASLWRLDMRYSLAGGLTGVLPDGPDSRQEAVVNRLSLAADGGTAEAAYLFEDASNGIMTDHRFADEHNYWTYFFRYGEGVTELRMNLDISGHFKVSVSRDLAQWTTILSPDEPQGRATLEADLTPFIEGGQSLYVKFEDGMPQDGFGPSLWNLELAYKHRSGLAISQPVGATTNLIRFPTLGGKVENRYMLNNNGSAIDAKNGHRYADWENNWVYGFSFYDDVTRAEFTADTGGEYQILLSTDGQSWTEMSAASGRPDRETVTIQADSLLGPDTRTLYIKFADRDTATGFGVRLRELQLAYSLRNGQPDTAPAPIAAP